MLPFTLDELNTSIADGRVTERQHPTLPLYIYNYSPAVQYDNRWDEVTLNCRGLILDEDGNIVARPWKKFFNLGQVNLPIQFDDPVEVMDKADGSLGILYPTPDGFDIATRGSFASEQAHTGSAIWWGKYHEYYNDPGETQYMREYTLLFEIIYPSNRIVLNYGDMTDLILLGAVENKTGYYIGPRAASAMFSWPGPVVETFDYKTISEAMGHMERKNAEGYVIRSHNFMVKLKQPDYLDLHRLVTNASPLTVWEKLMQGQSKSEIVSAFPDEFHDYIGSMADPLIEAYENRVQEILTRHAEVVARVEDAHGAGLDFPERKDYASEFKKSPEAKYHFMLLDGKPIREVVWRSLRPNGKGPGAWSEEGPDNSLG